MNIDGCVVDGFDGFSDSWIEGEGSTLLCSAQGGSATLRVGSAGLCTT